MEFLYSDSIDCLKKSDEFRIEIALDLFSLAIKYSVEKLRNMCEYAIERAINIDTVSIVLGTAVALGSEAVGLRDYCKEFIFNNFGEVVSRPTFV